VPEGDTIHYAANRIRPIYEGLALRYLHIGGGWADHAMYAITVEERS
jgi:hypothetical protein